MGIRDFRRVSGLIGGWGREVVGAELARMGGGITELTRETRRFATSGKTEFQSGRSLSTSSLVSVFCC